jgi:hypothetical protein
MSKKKRATPPPPEGMPRSEIPNNDIVSVARQFLCAADLLSPPGCLSCACPLMLNASLAIELFLKSLNARSEYHAEDEGIYLVTVCPTQHEHLLANLYDGLQPSIQAKMDAAYLAGRRIGGAATVREALEAVNDLFVYSRYPFEGQYVNRTSTNVSLLLSLARFFVRFVDGLEEQVTF